MFKCNKCSKEYKMKFHYDKHIAMCDVFKDTETTETAKEDSEEQLPSEDVKTVVGVVVGDYEGLSILKLRGRLSAAKTLTERQDILAELNRR